MSNKIKLVSVISLFIVIIILLMIFFRYNKTLIDEKDTNQEADNTNFTISNVDYNENELESNKEEIITVVLNSGKKDIVDEESNNTETTTENNLEKEEDNNDELPVVDNNTNTSIELSDIYYIKVNYDANVVTVYSKDNEGNYTVPCKAFTCSTGTATPTSGTYKIDYKYRWLGLFGNVYGQYCTRIVGNILFHSVPYLQKENPGSLEYWEYDKLRNFCFCRLY